MARYVWSGSSRNVGRFGTLATGDVVELTEAEAAYVDNDSGNLFFPEPVAARLDIPKSTAYTVLAADDGKTVVSTHSEAVTYTLPAAPSAGFQVEFVHSGTGDVTIDRNGKTIDGVASNLTLTAGRVGVYYNGAGWVSF